MQKHSVCVTVRAEVFGEDESGVADTIANAFDGPIPGIMNAEVIDVSIEEH